MKLTLPFIDQIRGSQNTGQMIADDSSSDQSPGEQKSLGGWIALTFNQLVAAITTGYHTEHNDDDTHKVIHASGAIYERGRTTAIGDWTDVAFASGNFSGSAAMTWLPTAVQVLDYSYIRLGSTLYLSFWIEAATIGGTASTTLKLTLPANLLVASAKSAACHFTNSTSGVGLTTATAGDTFISIAKGDGTAWSTGSLASVHGQIALRVGDGGSVAVNSTDPIITYVGSGGAPSGSLNFASVSILGLTTAGTYAMTVNRALTCSFKGCAAGGGGGSTNADTGADVVNPGGGGGGGGATTTGTIISFVPGKTYTLIVPAGGAASTGGTPAGSGNSGTDGGDGASLTFVNTTDTVTLVGLAGGSKGIHAVASSTEGAGGAGGALVTGINGITGGAGGRGGKTDATPAVAGANATNGCAGGGGGGIAASSVVRQNGAAGGTGSAAGGAAGVKGDHAAVNATAGGTASGVGGAATGIDGGGGGGGGGGVQFTGVTGQFGGGGGGGGPIDNISSTGRTGGAGGQGVGVLVFVSTP